jgi:hypothetical protein
MGFRCEVCKETFNSGERPERTVTKTREKAYDLSDSPRMGWEIVEEKLCCLPCSLKVDARVSKVFANPKLGSVLELKESGQLANDYYYGRGN